MDLSLDSSWVINTPDSKFDFLKFKSPDTKKRLIPKPRYISNLINKKKYKDNSVVPHSFSLSISHAVPEVI